MQLLSLHGYIADGQNSDVDFFQWKEMWCIQRTFFSIAGDFTAGE